MPVRYLPEGFHTITPHLTVPDAAKEIEFLVKAFEGVLKFKMENDNGEIRHAKFRSAIRC
jgi:PhnB protein